MLIIGGRFSLTQGGAVVQLFHKHLEGYLSAEGIFVQEPTENGKYGAETTAETISSSEGWCKISNIYEKITGPGSFT